MTPRDVSVRAAGAMKADAFRIEQARGWPVTEKGGPKCTECGKPHDFRWSGNKSEAGTWMDVDDGHFYRRQSDTAYISELLAEVERLTAELDAATKALRIAGEYLDRMQPVVAHTVVRAALARGQEPE